MKFDIKKCDYFEDNEWEQRWKWYGVDWGGIPATVVYVQCPGGYYGDHIVTVHRGGGRPCILHRVSRKGNIVTVPSSSVGQYIG